MDDWTYAYPDVDVPDSQPPLLNEDGLAIGALHTRAQQVEAVRVAELVQTQPVGVVGDRTQADVPLPFAMPPGVSLAF